MALYDLSSVAWWTSYVFFNAIFPKLSNDLPEVHEAERKLREEVISGEEFERAATMARTKIMNISYVWNNVGFTACCAVSLAAPKPSYLFLKWKVYCPGIIHSFKRWRPSEGAPRSHQVLQ